RIINMSFGAAYPDANLQDAVNYAIKNNVAIVAAAGNAGTDKVLYPAAYRSVISVGSLSRTLKKSYFTNYGVGLDLTAPGEEIAIADLDGGYSQAAGSSFAAAIVTGIASLAIATQPSISPTQLESKLTSTATPLSQPSPSSDFGYGVPNALALVQLPKLTQSATISASKNPIIANGIDESVVTIKVTDSTGAPQSNIPVTVRLNGEGNLINHQLTNNLGVGNTDSSGRVTVQVGSVVSGVKNLVVESSTGAFSNNPTFALNFQQPRSANYNMTWVKQSPYLVLSPGQSADLWVDVKNTGNVAWTSSINQTTANVKLGTDHNLDRTSIFQDGSWLDSNRVTLMSPNYVRPGEIARF